MIVNINTLLLMLVSGLRMPEAAALTKEGISIDGNKIIIDVKHGKGGKSVQILCMDDPYLTVLFQAKLCINRRY